MTRDESLALFEKTAAEEYEKHGMCADIASSNMLLARIMGKALLAAQSVEGRQFSYTATVDSESVTLCAPSRDELVELVRHYEDLRSSEDRRGFGSRG